MYNVNGMDAKLIQYNRTEEDSIYDDKNSQEINDALILIPSNRLLIETDAPYATPIPHRGKTNKPYYLEYIYEYLIKKLKRSDLQRLLLENSLTFFGMKGNDEN